MARKLHWMAFESPVEDCGGVQVGVGGQELLQEGLICQYSAAPPSGWFAHHASRGMSIVRACMPQQGGPAAAT